MVVSVLSLRGACLSLTVVEKAFNCVQTKYKGWAKLLVVEY